MEKLLIDKHSQLNPFSILIEKPIIMLVVWLVFYYLLTFSMIGVEAIYLDQIIAFLVTPTLIFIAGRIIIGNNYRDFRWKVSFRAIILQIIVAQNGELSNIQSQIAMETNDPTAGASTLVISSVLGIGFVVLTVISLYQLVNTFLVEIKRVNADYTNGVVSSRINEVSLMNDPVFGLTSNFINEILDHSENRLVSMTSAMELMTRTAEELNSASEEVNASAEEVSSTSQTMSIGASSQTSLITTVNDNIQAMQDAVEDIVRKIQLNTQEVVQIALQTNILALNAGIEASRAGDYGRGFAVVAENVRKLSDQSKIASERIEIVADEIRDSLQVSFSSISSTMINVVSVSEETAASAEEVAAAAEEMTASMEEVASLALKLSEAGLDRSNTK